MLTWLSCRHKFAFIWEECKILQIPTRLQDRFNIVKHLEVILSPSRPMKFDPLNVPPVTLEKNLEPWRCPGIRLAAHAGRRNDKGCVVGGEQKARRGRPREQLVEPADRLFSIGFPLEFEGGFLVPAIPSGQNHAPRGGSGFTDTAIYSDVVVREVSEDTLGDYVVIGEGVKLQGKEVIHLGRVVVTLSKGEEVILSQVFAIKMIPRLFVSFGVVHVAIVLVVHVHVISFVVRKKVVITRSRRRRIVHRIAEFSLSSFVVGLLRRDVQVFEERSFFSPPCLLFRIL